MIVTDTERSASSTPSTLAPGWDVVRVRVQVATLPSLNNNVGRLGVSHSSATDTDRSTLKQSCNSPVRHTYA